MDDCSHSRQQAHGQQPEAPLPSPAQPSPAARSLGGTPALPAADPGYPHPAPRRPTRGGSLRAARAGGSVHPGSRHSQTPQHTAWTGPRTRAGGGRRRGAPAGPARPCGRGLRTKATTVLPKHPPSPTGKTDAPSSPRTQGSELRSALQRHHLPHTGSAETAASEVCLLAHSTSTGESGVLRAR